MATYVGLDLTSGPRRPSALAVLDDRGTLCQVGLAQGDDDILALVQRWQPRYVAIDAPISLPKGMCCLEESCPCAPASPDGLKAAERELFRRGIGLYATTKRSIIKAMVYRAIGLRRTLEEQGQEVLEVYPYACKVALFDKPVSKKGTVAGQQWLRQRLEGRVPGLGEHQDRLSHDQLDAILAAHTAYLHGRSQTEAVGDPQEGVIHLPKAGAPQ